MEGNVRTLMLKALGYASFFMGMLIVCLYFTFPWSQVIPYIEDKAKATGIDLTIGEMASYRLSGLEVKGLAVRGWGALKESNPDLPLFSADELKFRVKLLPLLLGRTAGSFEAHTSGGLASGKISYKGTSTALELEVKNVILDRMGWPAIIVPNLRLGGQLSGKIDMDMPDMNNPEKWAGSLEIALQNAKVYPLNYVGLELPQTSFSSGILKAEVKEGMADIKAFKLESQDMPIEISSGAITMKNPPQNSLVTFEGKISTSKAYRESFPESVRVFVPDSKSVKISNKPLNQLAIAISSM